MIPSSRLLPLALTGPGNLVPGQGHGFSGLDKTAPCRDAGRERSHQQRLATGPRKRPPPGRLDPGGPDTHWAQPACVKPPRSLARQAEHLGPGPGRQTVVALPLHQVEKRLGNTSRRVNRPASRSRSSYGMGIRRRPSSSRKAIFESPASSAARPSVNRPSSTSPTASPNRSSWGEQPVWATTSSGTANSIRSNLSVPVTAGNALIQSGAMAGGRAVPTAELSSGRLPQYRRRERACRRVACRSSDPEPAIEPARFYLLRST